MGGAEKIMQEGKKLADSGEYFQAQEILNKLVQAEPQNQPAKDLLADVFEQIGYQQENPGLRNSYLSGAFELRSGIPQGAQIDSAGPDVVRAMSTELFLDFVGIRMDSRKAEGMQFTINLITPDNGEKFAIELSNATFTNVEGFLHTGPGVEQRKEQGPVSLALGLVQVDGFEHGADLVAFEVVDARDSRAFGRDRENTLAEF